MSSYGGVSDDVFKDDLTRLINKHSMENNSNTPDYILAQYIHGCLLIFERAIQQRENWYGRDPRPKSKIKEQTMSDAVRQALPRGHPEKS